MSRGSSGDVGVNLKPGLEVSGRGSASYRSTRWRWCLVVVSSMDAEADLFEQTARELDRLRAWLRRSLEAEMKRGIHPNPQFREKQTNIVTGRRVDFGFRHEYANRSRVVFFNISNTRTVICCHSELLFSSTIDTTGSVRFS